MTRGKRKAPVKVPALKLSLMQGDSSVRLKLDYGDGDITKLDFVLTAADQNTDVVVCWRSGIGEEDRAGREHYRLYYQESIRLLKDIRQDIIDLFKTSYIPKNDITELNVVAAVEVRGVG